MADALPSSMTRTKSLRDFHRDGTPTGGAAYLIRQIHALGAKVVWTTTNRVTCTAADGTRRVYVIDGLDPREPLPSTVELAQRELQPTPLNLALRDLQG